MLISALLDRSLTPLMKRGGSLPCLQESATHRHADCTQLHVSSILKLKTELHGLSPRANYTDRATAAYRRSDCQLFADRGCHVISVTDPYGRILGFLDRSRYFSIK
jgi:hypothetical protein